MVAEAIKRPMRIAEVVAAVLASGYKTNIIPAHFRTTIIRQLKAAVCREQGGKWVPA